MASTKSATKVVYIYDRQNSAEQRSGLNLMINMLSQTSNSDKVKLLDASVNHVAEFLIITKGNKIPNVQQFIEMLDLYPHRDIPLSTRKKMMAKLSDGIFVESPVKEKITSTMAKQYSPSLRPRFAELSDGSGTDSDQEDQQSQSGNVVQVKVPTDDEMTELLNDLMRTSTRHSARDKEREEEQMEKFKNALPKLDKGHMVAIFNHITKPQESTENQGRALSSIFQSIEEGMHGIIAFPMTSDTDSETQLRSIQGSIALACLIKQIFGQDHLSIKRQLQLIQAHAKQLSPALDMTKFKREHLGEIAIYDKLWMYYSTTVDKRETDHEFCEMLLIEVAKFDLTLAMQLRRNLESSDSILTMEELLIKLEENQRLMESLAVLSPAKSKSGGAQLSDKRGGKQTMANPAIQQQLKCTTCGSEHDISQCPKEKARLQKEAKQRGEKLPGSERSTKRGSQQPDKGLSTETMEDDDCGCYICFALGRPNWKRHDAEKCWKKKQFAEKLQDDEHRETMLKRLSTKSKSSRQDKASDHASSQSNPSRSSRNERQAQVPQGQIPNVQQMQQSQQMHQVHPQMYHRDPFSQQHMMSSQYSGEQVYPWQLQGMQNSVQSGSGLYNSGQFFQSPGQQTATRNAHVSQTMMQGNTGESPQMHFFDHRNAQNPLVLQVSPQNQIFRQADIRQMPAASDQGMLSIGVQGGTSNQQDRFSGADSLTANTAVQKPRGAELLAPFLGNYLTSSQQSQGIAMNAIVINPQNSYQAMTGKIVFTSAQTMNSDYEHVFTLATKTFHMLPLWILQRMANAKIEQDITSTASLLQSIVESANDVLHYRVEEGEELIHNVLKGVVGRVDGQGQCFIDTRNFLNGVEECSKVSRNYIINDLIKNSQELFGWETASMLIQSEYEFDIVKEQTAQSFSKFITEYNDGIYQSGVTELLYAAKRDQRDYIVVSSVDGETWCAVTAIFPCYENCQHDKEPAVVKAGVITIEQLKSPMILFSHGGLINPHVLGRQLTHFAPVTVADKIQNKDLLDQCCIHLSPDVDFNKENSSLCHSMNLTTLNIEKLLKAQAKIQATTLLKRIEKLQNCKNQKIIFHLFSDWIGAIKMLNGLRMIANEKGQSKQNQRLKQKLESLWKQWKHVTVVTNSTKVENVDIGQVFSMWKQYGKQVISRSKQLVVKLKAQIVIQSWYNWKILYKCSRVRFWILADTFSKWKYVVKQSNDNESKLDSSLVSHAVTTSSIDFDNSGVVQECNLTLSIQLSPVLSERRAIIVQKVEQMEKAKNIALLKHVIHVWKFLFRKAQIKRYHEIYLSNKTIRGWQKQFHQKLFYKRMKHKQLMFWFRNLQEETGLIQKRQLRRIWNSYFDQYLIKRYLNFWTSYYEAIHGITRTEMHMLFQKHIKRRTNRKFFGSWKSFVKQKYDLIQTRQMCENEINLRLTVRVFFIMD